MNAGDVGGRHALEPTDVRTAAELAADARNRAWRTALQGLAVDVLVAVAAVVLANVDGLDVTSGAAWAAVGITLGKTVVTAVASWVMRRFLDRSGVPTPRPPGEA